jgi:glycine dehydrogenase
MPCTQVQNAAEPEAAVQALLANIAAMYGVYHGPDGITRIAERCRALAAIVAEGARRLGYSTPNGADALFDTVCIDVGDAAAICSAATARGVNLRKLNDSCITVSVDETTTPEDVDLVLEILAGKPTDVTAEALAGSVPELPSAFKRTSTFMEHPVFHENRSEHDMLRCAALQALPLLGMPAALALCELPCGSCCAPGVGSCLADCCWSHAPAAADGGFFCSCANRRG